jgi:hypothetical protein
MGSFYNPFEYEQATKLSPQEIIKYYIEDFNYSRFINSTRNILLVGERGTGKTMTLLHNSLPVKILMKKQPFDIVNIYVPCNTPLTHKKEYLLYDEFTASVISEHFFVISILYGISNTLSLVPELLFGNEVENLKNDFEYILGFELPARDSIFDSLSLFFNRELAQTQSILNTRDIDTFCEKSISFSSGVMPFIACFRNCEKLKDTHFSLLIDDAQCLNHFQNKALNSWLSFRDNATISFKVATTKVDQPSLETSTGGSILEGHDYTYLDMEQPYRNQFSEFGKLAYKIIKKRLDQIGNEITPLEFFPENEQFKKDLEFYKAKVQKEAEQLYGLRENKKISDYVYKRYRAKYFRNRHRKANHPPYSGFETIVHLSSGVIRNLLDPCFKMYDRVYSELNMVDTPDSNKNKEVELIPPNIQNEVIIKRSKEKWEFLARIDNNIDNCSRRQAKHIKNLFDNLAVLFKERLLHHHSEPRAISFTISELYFSHYSELEELLTISRKAQMLYTYIGPSKNSGKRETYYVPNRMLWPEIGLDPVGQHARVSLKASVLYEAAILNKKIPFNTDPEKKNSEKQLGLFDE